MRPVLHGDVSAAARALLAALPQNRDRLCIRMIHEAELADKHVGQTGKLHPVFGNGSLMATARNRQLADEPGFDDVQYCRCFEIVLRHLIRFQISRTRN
ncbi:hypothetical protein RUE5091_00817 [Ruegeria denitrificans]|uniref:DUF7742 domain-containing protein n=1 Tax=Ruegeria denitrificans TaxID=1715692 RepID=A0A0N7M8M8_9RHOB|nr:hypothetical protein [Ruegeria denitrificans]CUJ89088.1 hypothetical protein RUE5091_00817 [Ruegeria denitrificans]